MLQQKINIDKASKLEFDFGSKRQCGHSPNHPQEPDQHQGQQVHKALNLYEIIVH